MPSPTVENYLKQIYVMAESRPDGQVPMGELAERMSVVPGTATSMVKALHRENWIRYEPRIGVALTPSGEEEALRVLRKHRILEMFLVSVLGLDWSEVHEEAELLEHALTDKLVNRMDDFLGNPEVDPHGDPIPTEAGAIRSRSIRCLTEVKGGDAVRIARIVQQDREFLDYLHAQGLVPGARLEVRESNPVADVVEVATENGARHALGGAVASQIRVEVLS
jgi:DtxR family Mn-dependent transcriptional regulator